MTNQTNELLQKYFNQTEIDSLIKFLREKKEKKIKITSLSKDEIVLVGELGKKYVLQRSQNQFREKELDVPNMERTSNTRKTPSRNLKSVKKIKTKKGKIVSSNAKVIVAAAVTVVTVGVLTGFQKNEKQTYSIMPNNQIESIIEQVSSMPKNMQSNEAIVTIHTEMPIKEEKINMELPTTIQETYVEVLQKEDMSKRMETDVLFGPSIDYYATRYGIPSVIGKALITQERPSDTHENIGQLTRNICGEKMLIPIIEKTPEDVAAGRELDKIYVVRDMPVKENFEKQNDFQQALVKYQNQLKEAMELETKGYQIFKFEDVIQNPRLCIQIAMANLSHCVYKCNGNVNQGIRGYNGGYGLSALSSDEEIASGALEIGDPFYNAHVFSHLFEGELDTVLWKIKKVNTLSEEELKNAEVITVKLQFNNVRNMNDEKENGYHF